MKGNLAELPDWIQVITMTLTHPEPRAALNEASFRATLAGKETRLYWIGGDRLTAAITNYGARLVTLYVPDRDGTPRDVVLGFDNIQDYEKDGDYHGAIVGRYANRIARGRFSLDGKDYTLAINNPPNHLHGGSAGFSARVWEVVETSPEAIGLRYLSADGEEGYPGNVALTVRYSIEGDTLSISFEATTDAPTVLNVCNHAYWNLNGQGIGSAMEHTLFINAARFTPVDEFLIPTGELAPVKGTPFDFTTPTAIGERIDDHNRQLGYGDGYDHNFALVDRGEDRSLAAVAVGDRSGIEMAIYTTEPGLQLYSGNYLRSLHRLKYGLADDRRSAFCLETQHFPDSPNRLEFPSVVLRPGETFRGRTEHTFRIARD
ncbi:aldose epimerase family protein [Pannus brasiliensis CCIBt3594]|uniref:Aldose 1-epimerase n=1 Tax=Pannus brasiliensis CCIBt3594 TaxID=1427578 RepID=A0AAW9QR37_9CHRO